MNTLLKNKNILTLVISCMITIFLLGSSSIFHVLNKGLQNSYYSMKNEVLGIGANPHIIVVEIDDRSFQEIGNFPFSRGVYAQVLENLSQFSPAVIALDILFLDPSEPDGDQAFQKALSETPNVVLGSALNNGGKIQRPFSLLETQSYDTGFLSPNIDKSNRTVYSFSPSIETTDGYIYEHFTITILRAFYEYLYSNEEFSWMGEYTSTHYTFSPELSLPLAQNHSDEVLINFIPEGEFTRISLVDLYDKEVIRQIDADIDLQDAIILIGPAAEGLNDEFSTPNGLEYGVNIHANILNTILSGKFMMYFHRQLEWLMIFFLVVLSVSVNLSSSGRFLLFGNLTIIFIFWFLIPVSIVLGTNLILNYPSEIIFSLILAFSAANIVKYLIEDENKNKLNKALSEYVSSDIAQEILSGGGKVNLNGEERFLVCFFSDIEGFTSLSERLSPAELIAFLREYLSAVTSVIMKQKGHVDKFEGDAVMAMWGTFTKHTQQDFINACYAALMQQQVLRELNKKWSQKMGGDVRVRMGIHAGNAIVGNIGAIGKKMDFTALGDNVNTASRLEGVNKHYGTYICVSEGVYQSAKNDFHLRYLDEIQVQGKDIPVKIYELIGKKGDILKQKLRNYSDFESGVEFYRQRNFIGAKEIFESLVLTGDAPSKVYVERCEKYIKNPPEEDWNGVWRMTEK